MNIEPRLPKRGTISLPPHHEASEALLHDCLPPNPSVPMLTSFDRDTPDARGAQSGQAPIRRCLKYSLRQPKPPPSPRFAGGHRRRWRAGQAPIRRCLKYSLRQPKPPPSPRFAGGHPRRWRAGQAPGSKCFKYSLRQPKPPPSPRFAGVHPRRWRAGQAPPEGEE